MTDKARSPMEEALELFVSFGCPVCNGDCSSANPPVMACPMQTARAALSTSVEKQIVEALALVRLEASRIEGLLMDDEFARGMKFAAQRFAACAAIAAWNTRTALSTKGEASELVKRLREFEISDALGNGDFSVCEEAADEIERLLSTSVEKQIVEWLRAEAEPLSVMGDKKHIINRIATVIESGAWRGER